jgi:hypothetical protein
MLLFTTTTGKIFNISALLKMEAVHWLTLEGVG